MKKLLLITILLFSIFLISCSENIEDPISDNSQYTSISISFDKNFIPSNILKLNLVLTGTTTYDTTINLKDNPDIVITWDSLTPTTWHLGVLSFDSSDVLINKGTTIINVSKGVQSKVVLRDLGNSLVKTPYTWTDLQGPIFDGCKISLDTFGVNHPTVLFEDGITRMWYVGLNSGKSQIFNTSCQVGKTWNLNTTPTISPRENQWDSYSLQNPKVIKVNSTYIMYYSSNMKIGMATSTDGINWQRNSQFVTVNGIAVQIADILYANNIFYIYYVGTSNNSNNIYLGSSNNGYNFASIGPIISATHNWEGYSLKNPSVVFDRGYFKAVYTDNSGVYIGYAESLDGFKWTKSHSAIFGYDSLQANWGRSFTGLSLKRVNDELKIFFSAKVPNQNLYKIGMLSKKN